MSIKKISIFIATRNGQTRAIANYMKDKAMKESGGAVFVEVSEISRKTSHLNVPHDTDLILLGAPVYAQKFPSFFIKWVQKHRQDFKGKKTAFFSVSLNAVDKRPECRKADDALIRKFINNTGWVPNFVASLGGALKYQSYNWVMKRIMRRISASAGGPTDMGVDHILTDWNIVDSFLKAIVELDINSSFSTKTRFPQESMLDYFMPEFEQRSVQGIFIKKSPEEIYAAFQTLDPKEMRLAQLLAKIRTLGKKDEAPSKETFFESARRFGSIPLFESPPNRFIGGLIGKFWTKEFGIVSPKPEQFLLFDEPDFSKVVTQFQIESSPLEGGSIVKSEMRIHSTNVEARRKFRIYWGLLRVGIDLYMRSILAALKRHAERDEIPQSESDALLNFGLKKT